MAGYGKAFVAFARDTRDRASLENFIRVRMHRIGLSVLFVSIPRDTPKLKSVLEKRTPKISRLIPSAQSSEAREAHQTWAWNLGGRVSFLRASP